MTDETKGMRRLFLHCGLPKTGTTYLQKFFLKNRAILEAAGLGWGPYMDEKTGSHYPGFVEAVETRGAEAVLAATEACRGENIFVSNEDLVHFLLEVAPDGRPWGAGIRDAAAGRFELVLIVYLRRQDFLKESIFSQVVKDWYCGDIHGYTQPGLDLDAKLRGLEALFGQQSIRPVIYDDVDRGDIVQPMLEILGIGLPRTAFAPIGRENSAMHRRKVLFLAGLPKAKAPGPASPAGFAARFVTRVLAKSDVIADDGVRYLLSPTERHALVAAHLEGNRAIVARYGIARPGSFVALPDLTEPWTPPAPISREETSAVWRATLAACFAGRNPLRGAWLAARLSRPFLRLRASGRASGHSAPAPLATESC